MAIEELSNTERETIIVAVTAYLKRWEHLPHVRADNALLLTKLAGDGKRVFVTSLNQDVEGQP